MTAISFNAREAILREAVASDHFGAVECDRFYHPSILELPSQAILRQSKMGYVFILWINPDGSLTRARDRFVPVSLDQQPAWTGA